MYEASYDDYTAGRYDLAIQGFQGFIQAFPRLPNAADETYIKSLMKPNYERGKMANWIAPPVASCCAPEMTMPSSRSLTTPA